MPKLIRVMTQLPPEAHKSMKEYAMRNGMFLQRCFQVAVEEYLESRKAKGGKAHAAVR